MRVRLIHVTTRRSGAASRREERLEVGELRVGRGTDNELELADLTVSLRHARFVPRAEGLWVESVEGAELRVGGARRDSRRIEAGDVVRVGPFDLRVLPAGAGEDLVLEVEQRERRGDALEQIRRRTRIGVERGWLTRRKLAWGLALAILASCVVLPLATGHLLRSWNSGPIALVHAPIAHDCAACHAVAFERVRNESCLACHGEVGSHAPVDHSPGELDARRCAGCHLEHNGAEGLARVASTECTGCHSDLHGVAPETQVADASDFGADHAEFRLQLLDPATRKAYPEEWKPDLKESPGVRFNHLRHVGRVVPLPDGTKGHLRCDACHQRNAAGRTMEPIRFETHCRECHALSFDLVLPDRQAIHGDPVAMREDLRGVYAELAIRGDPRLPDAPRFAAPGRPATLEQRQLLAAWVDERVSAAETYLMERDGECRRCHELRPGAARDGGTDVAPVAVASVWMPSSAFSHATHAPFPCRDCHAAAAVYDPEPLEPGDRVPRPAWSEPGRVPYGLLSRDALRHDHGSDPSESADDVLVPGIERCRACHAGPEASPPLVASECVLCHPFHRVVNGSILDRSAASDSSGSFP